MTKPRCIIHRMLILIIVAYPILSLLSTSSSQYYYHHAYGQAAIDTTEDIILPAIDGIECDRVEQLAFHTHTQFNITINNQSYPVPSGIGIIQDYCVYWVHTHDNSGLIHMESPVEKEFTLGQFLSIWSKFNSSDTVVQNLTENSINGTVIVYVNGTQMVANNNNNNSTDYRELALKDSSNISLIISRG